MGIKVDVGRIESVLLEEHLGRECMSIHDLEVLAFIEPLGQN